MTLYDAYKAARCYKGESPLSGSRGNRRPAALALTLARERLDAFREARAEYETAAAIASERLAAFRAAGHAFAFDRYGRPVGEASGTAKGREMESAFREADRIKSARLAEVTRARAKVSAPEGDFGAVTWQASAIAGEEDSALPFSVPPAMANPRRARGHGRHMDSNRNRNRGDSDSSGALFYLQDSDALRDIRDADDVTRLDHTGWYTEPNGETFRDGTGLCVGVVGQLRGRDGLACYVPGYRFGGMEDAGTFDASQIVTAEGREEWQAEDAAEDAARIADGMAETAAEREREYQAAWRAGTQWAELAEAEAETRRNVLTLLKENRESGGSRDLPAIHETIRDAACSAWREICESRRKRAALADGDDDGPFPWYPSARLKAAFCEGADVESFPA